MPARKNTKGEEVQVSFLPEARAALSGTSRAERLLMAVVAVIIVAIGLTVLYLRLAAASARSSVQSLRAKTAQLQAQVSADEEKVRELGNIGALAGVARTALDNHITGETILSVLEQTTVAEVYFTQLAADASGTLVLSARAKDYSAVVRQLRAWQSSSDIAEAQTSGVTAALDKAGAVSGIDFTATVKLKKEVFTAQP